MDEVPRELQWAEAFVALADTLLDDFDIIDFLHVLAEHCVTLLNVTAAGVMIADHEGRLRVTGSSTERAEWLELFDLLSDEGRRVRLSDFACLVLGEAIDRSPNQRVVVPQVQTGSIFCT